MIQKPNNHFPLYPDVMTHTHNHIWCSSWVHTPSVLKLPHTHTNTHTYTWTDRPTLTHAHVVYSLVWCQVCGVQFTVFLLIKYQINGRLQRCMQIRCCHHLHTILHTWKQWQPVVNNIDNNYIKFLMGRQVLHTYKVTPGRLGISCNQLFLLFCLHVVVTWWNTKLAIPSWTGQNILLPENSV